MNHKKEAKKMAKRLKRILLENKVNELEHDIRQLIMYPNHTTTEFIRMKYKVRYDLQKIQFFGAIKNPAVS